MLKYLLTLLFGYGYLVHGQMFVDERDHTSYTFTQLGHLFWMTENLRYDAKGSTCLQDCDQIRFYDYQNLQGVCPEGWRLPTMEEWDLFTDSFEGVQKAKMMENNKKNYRVDFLDQYNLFDANVLHIQNYGRMEGGKVGKGNFIDYWTTNQSTDDRFHMHITPYSITGHTHKHHLKTSKPEEYRLFPIRCVCEIKD